MPKDINKEKHFVYIVECRDGTFYTGYTTDVERRLEEHNSGEGAKYTRGRYPVELRYKESFGSRSSAQKKEYKIKQLSRREKEELIDSN
ncbi:MULTISPECIES: GIY-YIG nuclease family protein [unclassified Halanaerobium]|uniref:GIY-YIG nuclease family protein n=1 Tax=unclassified Halanaerobium TaxID=2641197 RepID=UPI000DF13EFD|nr:MULTISPECIES: GIY-YIG nuclease family protein [unclassified Halanaerobium]RCW49936.1 putative endonuclease [Halanaerobium sp. MA284_MarDTE_T2]RCW81077.1 putative endonuclease [Halanaerobium sp. DL-01]